MTFDVSHALDEGRWTGYQKLLIACTALAIILDGIDNQLLGTAIPTMAKEWVLTRNDFSTALAMGPVGMLIGGALGGWLGDRIGRRTALLTSVLAFAVPTMLIYFAQNVTALSALRFFAGLGLGGAMPSATALAAEYVPRRQRPFAVTLTIVCVPLGATLAAETSAHIIPMLGWQKFFLLGGLLPIVLGAILFAFLPESPRFLATQRKRWPELASLLRKMGIDVPQNVVFGEQDSAAVDVDNRDQDAVVDYAGVGIPSKPPNAVAAMLGPALRRDTLALFACFFFGLLVSYLSLQLLVTALVSAGFSEFDSRSSLFWWNIGGVGGAILGALVIQRLGSRKTMLGLCALAVASSVALAGLPLSKSQPLPAAAAATTAGPIESRPAPVTAAAVPTAKPKLSLDSPVGLAMILLCIVMGAAVNAVQVAMYALAAHVYPTEIRGTGLGVTVAVGRGGNILASYVGNFALDRGISAYFATSAIGMILVLVSLAFVRRHIERSAIQNLPVEVGATIE